MLRIDTAHYALRTDYRAYSKCLRRYTNNRMKHFISKQGRVDFTCLSTYRLNYLYPFQMEVFPPEHLMEALKAT